MPYKATTGARGLGLAVIALLGMSAYAVTAAAQPPEAEIVMDNMVDAKIIEQVDYAFLAVAYDVDNDVLYFAAKDGEHFDPAMEVAYRVPIASINHVNVISNSDVAIIDGKETELETGFDDSASGDFERLSRGCTVKLDAKDYDFGWAGLHEGVVSDGKFTVDYVDLEVDPTQEVMIGFYECDHARKMQEELHKLHKQVKKGM